MTTQPPADTTDRAREEPPADIDRIDVYTGPGPFVPGSSLREIQKASAELRLLRGQLEARDIYGENYHRCYCDRGYDHVSNL